MKIEKKICNTEISNQDGLNFDYTNPDNLKKSFV